VALPPDVVDLARQYRFRHGWILLDPRAAKERRKLRGMENVEEVKAGVRPSPRQASAPTARPSGLVRFRNAESLRETRPTRERQQLRGMENAEIARERGGGGGKVTTSGLSPTERANRATQKLTGRNASDFQHRAAASLHARAAKAASSPQTRAHHIRAAKMHRGIAGRTPGRRTRGELSLRRTAGSQLADVRSRRAAHSKLAARGVILSTELATYAGAPPGSGRNFAKLKGTLAKRGARNPGALAAWIGRRKYGRKGFAKLSAKGRSRGHSNTGPALEFTMTHLPVNSPFDLVISRSDEGTAVIRHRNGGDELGQIRRDGRGWVATIGGKDQPQRTHQRSALADVIGVHNKSALTSRHRPASAGESLQPAPRQTQLMEAYGIPAIRALATPMTGASSGPRVTDRDGDGLSAKGRAIHGRLKKRGFPPDRAVKFARRAQNFKRRGQ
jgi:hypothetical protein